MRQYKIALSLAIVGAAAAPFIFGSYKMNFQPSSVVVALTTEEKEQMATKLKSNNYCQEQRDRLSNSHNFSDTLPVVACDT